MWEILSQKQYPATTLYVHFIMSITVASIRLINPKLSYVHRECECLLHITVQWLALLFCIRKLLHLSRILNVSYPAVFNAFFLSDPPGRCYIWYPKIGHSWFLTHPFCSQTCLHDTEDMHSACPGL